MESIAQVLKNVMFICFLSGFILFIGLCFFLEAKRTAPMWSGLAAILLMLAALFLLPFYALACNPYLFFTMGGATVLTVLTALSILFAFVFLKSDYIKSREEEYFCLKRGALIIFVWYLIASIIFVLAAQDMPSGYYEFLRYEIFLISLGSAIIAPSIFFGIPMIGLAILYNPLLPVHLRDKDLWTTWNTISGIAFWILFALTFFAGRAKIERVFKQKSPPADGAAKRTENLP